MMVGIAATAGVSDRPESNDLQMLPLLEEMLCDATRPSSLQSQPSLARENESLASLPEEIVCGCAVDIQQVDIQQMAETLRSLPEEIPGPGTRVVSWQSMAVDALQLADTLRSLPEEIPEPISRGMSREVDALHRGDTPLPEELPEPISRGMSREVLHREDTPVSEEIPEPTSLCTSLLRRVDTPLTEDIPEPTSRGTSREADAPRRGDTLGSLLEEIPALDVNDCEAMETPALIDEALPPDIYLSNVRFEGDAMQDDPPSEPDHSADVADDLQALCAEIDDESACIRPQTSDVADTKSLATSEVADGSPTSADDLQALCAEIDDETACIRPQTSDVADTKSLATSEAADGSPTSADDLQALCAEIDDESACMRPTSDFADIKSLATSEAADGLPASADDLQALCAEIDDESACMRPTSDVADTKSLATSDAADRSPASVDAFHALCAEIGDVVDTKSVATSEAADGLLALAASAHDIQELTTAPQPSADCVDDIQALCAEIDKEYAGVWSQTSDISDTKVVATSDDICVVANDSLALGDGNVANDLLALAASVQQDSVTCPPPSHCMSDDVDPLHHTPEVDTTINEELASACPPANDATASKASNTQEDNGDAADDLLALAVSIHEGSAFIEPSTNIMSNGTDDAGEDFQELATASHESPVLMSAAIAGAAVVEASGTVNDADAADYVEVLAASMHDELALLEQAGDAAEAMCSRMPEEGECVDDVEALAAEILEEYGSAQPSTDANEVAGDQPPIVETTSGAHSESTPRHIQEARQRQVSEGLRRSQSTSAVSAAVAEPLRRRAAGSSSAQRPRSGSPRRLGPDAVMPVMKGVRSLQEEQARKEAREVYLREYMRAHRPTAIDSSMMPVLPQAPMNLLEEEYMRPRRGSASSASAVPKQHPPGRAGHAHIKQAPAKAVSPSLQSAGSAILRPKT